MIKLCSLIVVSYHGNLVEELIDPGIGVIDEVAACI